MKIIFLSVLTAFVWLAAFQTASAQTIQPRDITEIILETGDGFCFDCGRVTTLRSDGAATYHGGKKSRLRSGDYTGAISKTEFARLAKIYVEAGFFDFKPRYEGTTHDVSSVVLTVVYAGGQKTVENFKRSDEPKFKMVEQAFNAANSKIKWQKAGTKPKRRNSNLQNRRF